MLSNEGELMSKGKIWTPSERLSMFELYNETQEEEVAYIKKANSKGVVFEIRNNSIIEEAFKEGKKEQMWKREEEANSTGYFTLTHSSGRVLTAISADEVVIEGT